jgi:hypothetical protein
MSRGDSGSRLGDAHKGDPAPRRAANGIDGPAAAALLASLPPLFRAHSTRRCFCGGSGSAAAALGGPACGAALCTL